MTCCKSTSTGVGIPTTAPSNNDPDIYIEQPSGQIWVWNGTKWVMPPVGAVSYDSTTRVLTVGSSSVTLPIASKTEYGVVKLADPATDPNNPIEANTDGTLTINCVKLIQHCGLATKAYVDGTIGSAISGLSGAQIVNLLTSMSSTDLAGLACKLKSSAADNLLQCRADGLYYGIAPPAELVNQYVDPINGNDANAGTRASPLRTIIKAIDKLPEAVVGAYIHLHESATHYMKSSDRRDLNKSVNFRTYGNATDIAQATWSHPQNLWAWYGWATSPRAVIEFVFDRQFEGNASQVIGVAIDLNASATMNFDGVVLKAPSLPSNLQTAVPHWNCCLTGNGIYRITDCDLVGFSTTTPLFATATHWSFKVVMSHPYAENAGTLFSLMAGGVANVEVYSRGLTPGNSNQGLPWHLASDATSVVGKVTGRLPVAPQSPNYIINPII